MTAIPSHWRRVRLGDVLDSIEAGKSFSGEPRAARDDEWGIIKVSAMTYGQFREGENKAVPAGARFSASAEIQPGDLLLSRANTRDYVGASVLVGTCRPRLLLSDKSLRLHPTDAVDRRWLWYALSSPTARQFLSEASTGVKSGMRNVSQQALRTLPLALPPIGEQRRIVEILEDCLSHLDAALRQLERAILRARTLGAAITDRALFAVAWPMESVGGLLREGMRNGHSAPTVLGEGGVRTLTLTAVTRGEFSDRYTKMTKADPDRVRSLWLKPGDILVQRSNTPALVGSSAIYSGVEDWAIFPDLLIRLRADERRVTSQYLAMALRAERSHRWLRSRAKGLAGSMPKIDQGTIAELKIPVPPDLETQDDVVARTAEAWRACDRLRRACEQAEQRSASLRRALLSAAFSGRISGVRDVSEVVGEMAGV